MANNVGDQFVATLSAAGIRRIYGIVGDSLNAITDAIRRDKGFEWVHTRHEEVAAFAAGAEAHLTGKLAVCAGSCGPGNMHLINGLYDCHRSGVPVLAIAADIPSAESGSSYFQETRPQQLFRDCSHYCELVSHPSQMPRVLEIAMREAIGKRGVAVIAIPGDVALQPAEGPFPPNKIDYLPRLPIVVPAGQDLDALARMLNLPGKVTLFCGAGCAGAHDEVVALAEKLKAPVVHALRGKEHVEWDNPFDVGMTGLIGFSSGYYAMEDCETLLILGTNFPYRQFYPANARIAQVDIRPENLGRKCRIDLGVVGDVASTLRALLPMIEEKHDRAHLDRSLQHYRKARKSLDDLATGTPGRPPIHPQHVVRVVSELASEDAVFTCDVGEPTIWAARYLQMNGRRRLIGSFNHGSMANALPQAIGAQTALPGRQVISMSGDGGFAMLMGELLTVRQLKLPVKTIIFNNGTLGFVELEQKSSGYLNFGVDLDNPSFAAMAEAANVRGIRIEDPADLEEGINEALKHDGPVVVDVVVNRQELSMPPKITAEMAKGFTLFMLKTVMSGRGDELVELARTNLWR
jgi:pyruvate dehydrogenase (quinone)